MKKIKISGVSLCTLLAATGANAAGYTCEELIEYTSCVPGYYLSSTDTTCPDGYVYVEDACYTEDSSGVEGELIYSTEDVVGQLIKPNLEACDGLEYSSTTCASMESFCKEANEWIGTGCFKFTSEYGDEVTWDVIAKTTGQEIETTCNECPVGSACAGGTAAAEECDGETYADAAGLASCKSCRDAAVTIGVTNDMITGITGGATCNYDLKVTANHGVYNIQCNLDGYEPDTDGQCRVVAHDNAFIVSDYIKCDAGYYMESDVIESDCDHNGFNSYSCSGGSANYADRVSDFLNMYSCVAAPLGTYSAGGWDYLSCPSTGLFAENGGAVQSTTVSTASQSVADCIIPTGVKIKNEKGIYQFKSNCAFDTDQHPSCEYYELFATDNPNDYTCGEDYELEEGGMIYNQCDGDPECIKHLGDNCARYVEAYENEQCDDNGCTVDLGYGVTCRFE